MPCVERFLKMDKDYQEKVLPAHVKKRVAIEASAKDYWYRFTGLDGQVIGLDRFGTSAPAKDAYQDLNITTDATIKAIRELVKH